MSKAEALKTGFFTPTSRRRSRAVTRFPLQWKKKYKGVDVLTRDDGSIASLGVFKGGPKTSKGIGYGSTLDELIKAYPNLSPVVDAGFNQAGAYEFTGRQVHRLPLRRGDRVEHQAVVEGDVHRGHRRRQARNDAQRLLTQRTAARASGNVNAPA